MCRSPMRNLAALFAFTYTVHSFQICRHPFRTAKKSGRGAWSQSATPDDVTDAVIVEDDRSNKKRSEMKLVVGLCKYSHDSSICAADAETGEVLFYLSKERLSRRKHDGGPTGTLVEEMLHTLRLDVSNIDRVVVNNHHHRVLPQEESFAKLEWQVGLGINYDNDDNVLDEYNLLSEQSDNTHELSHHIAHAYSVAAQAPFERGLVVVMDGMGETFGAMASAVHERDEKYSCDLMHEGSYICIPSDIREKTGVSRHGWREGESAYTFAKDSDGGLSVMPIFKRFVEEKSPPTLYNHGFENMESVGAVYSRASSHIFGDWNACGKVMGLAPWYEKWGKSHPLTETMSGKLYMEHGKDAFVVHQNAIVGEPLIDASYEFNDELEPDDLAKQAIALAESVQRDLEKVSFDFIKWLKEYTNEDNLCLAGGVALNSVMNGKVRRELGFENVFIPPYPGDDGIAVGCCAYGLFGNKVTPAVKSAGAPLWTKPLTPYLGPIYDDDDIENAIEKALPWIEVNEIMSEKDRLEATTSVISSGGVVAWFHGRSEAGPRALGHRSILADPRKGKLVKFINNGVKERESFRPFAPSVLAEHADEWFVDVASNASPYMSMTTLVRGEKASEIPSVTHIDRSSRLQTVRKEDEPLYHKLISAFHEATGVPLVLNTSFNTLKGEPIVETPDEAIRSFLKSMNSIEMLVLERMFITKKDPDGNELFESERSDGLTVKRKIPVRAGPFMFESSGSVNFSDEEDGEIVTRRARVRMPDRILHDDRINGGWVEVDELDAEILGLCNGGEMGAQEMIEAFSDTDGNAIDDTIVQAILDSLLKLYHFTFIKW